MSEKILSFQEDLISNVIAAHDAVRNSAPLVHNITNLVVMHTTANALLAAGASPLMAHDLDELDDMLNIASALVLNIGTLDTAWIASMRQAGLLAARKDVPVVLDPVGAGASTLRTNTALMLLQDIHPAVVRGNASEIMALVDHSVTSKGVDSLQSSSDAIAAACSLAQKYACVVSISGTTDIITNGIVSAAVTGGSPLMAKVTGMGCTATALTAACVAGAQKSHAATHTGLSPAFTGAVTAMALMAEAGDQAAASAHGPGTFLPLFLDALYVTTSDMLPHHLAAIEA